ncbi:MAG: hypothetical protein KC636_10565, partial [Myxococcales bacterium]|nr:hypothetical protein [Myxococcales bacterium]
DEREVQDLCYHYDPSGNIAELRDLAQQVIFFQNASVEPTQKFVYDAVYRLIEATGREHHTLTMPTLRQNDRSAAELDADMGRGRRLAYADHGSGEIKR